MREAKYDEQEIDYQQQIVNCNGLIMKCTRTKRIIHALKFYQENDMHESLVVEELKEKYPHIMDNYIHLISTHNDKIQLEALRDELLKMKKKTKNETLKEEEEFKDLFKDAIVKQTHKRFTSEIKQSLYMRITDDQFIRRSQAFFIVTGEGDYGNRKEFASYLKRECTLIPALGRRLFNEMKQSMSPNKQQNCVANNCPMFHRHHRDRAKDQRQIQDMKDENDTKDIKTELGSLAQCDNRRLIHLFTSNQQFRDHVQMDHSLSIISYISYNNIDGKDMMKMKREEFADAVVSYCHADECRDAALTVYDIFTNSLFTTYDNSDDELLFYRDLMDGIHCYLYHLEDVVSNTNKFNLLTRSNVPGMMIHDT